MSRYTEAEKDLLIKVAGDILESHKELDPGQLKGLQTLSDDEMIWQGTSSGKWRITSLGLLEAIVVLTKRMQETLR